MKYAERRGLLEKKNAKINSVIKTRKTLAKIRVI